MLDTYPAGDQSNWRVSGRLEKYDHGLDTRVLVSWFLVIVLSPLSLLASSMSTIKLFRS